MYVCLSSMALKGKTAFNLASNFTFNPACNYMFKVNNRNNRTRCEICSGVVIVNFEHILHLALVFLLLTLSR